MEDFLLKNNFIGKDGFVWWVGQIATEGSWINNTKEAGWGNRYKVRIMGYHPYSTAQLSDENLPWALVMLPPGVGTGSAGVSKSIKFQQGDVVVGFFLDGDDGQVPVIMGSFGNTTYKADRGDSASPFGVFSGYGESFKKAPDYVIKNNETNQPTADSQPSPRNLPPRVVSSSDNKSTYTSTDGIKIPLPCGEDGEENKGSKGTINKIKNAIQGFIDFLQNAKAMFDEKTEYYRDWIKQEIDTRAEQIQKMAAGLVAGMVSSTFERLIPILSKGLDMLYMSVFNKVLAATGNFFAAVLAGEAAQLAMVKPVKVLHDLLECIVNQVVEKLLSPIKDILKSVADNVLNFADCVADQTVGAVLNGIVGFVTEGLLPALNGISKILQFFENFSLENLMRNGIDALLGLIGLRSCSKPSQKDKYGACKYMLGYGPVKQDEPDLEGIVKNSNVAKAASVAAQVSGFPLDGVQDIVGAYSVFSDTISDPASEFLGDVDSCFAGIPTLCGPPKINIFGGGGEGGAATALMGLITGEGNNKTGSVISVQVTNPGNNYTFPPFVEVVDECGQGYGCVARATVKNGQIDTIYVVSEGENYPVDEEIPYIVDSVSIIDPGSGYEEDDIITDNLGNEYRAEVFLGSIVKVTPINSKDITDIPVISVKTATGSGALLSANLGPRREFQGEVQQVIDCIT